VEPLRHSYTNDTRGDGVVVVKRYQGPDAARRRRRERAVLRALAGRLPVPPLLDGADPGATRMGFLPGVPGQELVDAGAAGPALRACGTMLRRIHEITIRGYAPGEVLVHGDYGPNNVLISPDSGQVTGVLDWEWAHPGTPIEDLAWCEWIVRMHHPAQVAALDAFFAGYGARPGWARRHAAMVDRCRELREFCRPWTDAGVRLWQNRLAVTAGWSE
jgi:aminoglycoside phosphotransferase